MCGWVGGVYVCGLVGGGYVCGWVGVWMGRWGGMCVDG